MATPFTAATVVVPLNVPLPALLPNESVTLLESVVSRSPNESRTCTLMLPMDAPAVVVDGETLNERWLAVGAMPASVGTRMLAIGVPIPVARS